MASPQQLTATQQLSIDRLNQQSLTRSFVPQTDIDWSATTTEQEFELLYPAWSLLAGSGRDTQLHAEQRVQYATYQQINLMLFTELIERHAVIHFMKTWEDETSAACREYLAHFVKEELYHTVMFSRAGELLYRTLSSAEPLPTRALSRTVRSIFFLIRLLPSRRLRSNLSFTLFQFAERVSLVAHQVVSTHIPRKESLVAQVWRLHAIDEARHVAFDRLVIERNQLWKPLTWLPALLAAPAAVLLSALINLNEIRIARRLGVPVHWWQLPQLVQQTQAPFKRQVFDLLRSQLPWSKAYRNPREDNDDAR